MPRRRSAKRSVRRSVRRTAKRRSVRRRSARRSACRGWKWPWAFGEIPDWRNKPPAGLRPPISKNPWLNKKKDGSIEIKPSIYQTYKKRKHPL